MHETRLLMGMPITVEIADRTATQTDIEQIYTYLVGIDKKFSTYKPESEISQLNQNPQSWPEASPEIQVILALADQTKKQTDGYFDVFRNGYCDPSGIVKGWAIHQAANLLRRIGREHFLINAGGDIEVAGHNQAGQPWRIGIRDPFDETKIIRTIIATNIGIATSGTSMRGQHIYNPRTTARTITDSVSLTVIGPNCYEADRFATAAFAMGRPGIHFIEQLPGFEGYLIEPDRKATMTSGFETYT